MSRRHEIVMDRIGLSKDRLRGTMEDMLVRLSDQVLTHYPGVFLEVEHTDGGAVFRVTGDQGQIVPARMAVEAAFSHHLAEVMRVR